MHAYPGCLVSARYTYYLCMYLCVSMHLCIYASMYLGIYASIYLSIYLSVCLSVCLSVYQTISKPIKQSNSTHSLTHSINEYDNQSSKQSIIQSSYAPVVGSVNHDAYLGCYRTCLQYLIWPASGTKEHARNLARLRIDTHNSLIHMTSLPQGQQTGTKHQEILSRTFT